MAGEPNILSKHLHVDSEYVVGDVTPSRPAPRASFVPSETVKQGLAEIRQKIKDAKSLGTLAVSPSDLGEATAKE